MLDQFQATTTSQSMTVDGDDNGIELSSENVPATVEAGFALALLATYCAM
jgi:hypothetical protein